MKKTMSVILLAGALAACNAPSSQIKDLRDKSFSELFTQVDPAAATGNVFKLVGQDFSVITAGTELNYNSMTASWGGWGILFNEPATWCILRANRYTLEYIRRENLYTMCYFDTAYKDQVMLFGSASGRDSDKMKQHTLTPVETPEGSIAYKEAKLIVECELLEITTVQPGDFYTADARTFITDAYAEAHDYHKLVFGKITGMWVKK
ncbi:MAG: flavin reductase [Prevotellaceae bacterium]|jgi:flavin reductase (DIM6/NTAB) family NADH-FMN oxidoreductase RutF|nr:flavin reductase [Prevotellaceae bacterium]